MARSPSSTRSRALDWLDERSGIRQFVRSQLFDYLIPATTNRWYSLGFVVLLFVGIQFVTGLLLLFYYVPDASRAFESVERIMHEVPFGWLIRLVHVHGANAMMIALLAHLVVVVVTNAYKKPRELHWLTGCLLLFTTLGLCFTGYLLPWSQLSFWATTVGMKIVESVPFVGPTLMQYFQGGYVVGPTTLGRAFAFHASLLPALLSVLIVIHIILVRHTGISPLPTATKTQARKKRRFFPGFVIEDLAVGLGALSVFCAVLFFAPHLYLPHEAFDKADPFVTPLHVKPEWYFLAQYQVLRLIPNKTLGILSQLLAFGALVLLPFLDRGEVRNILRRPVFLGGVIVVVLGLVALTIMGALA
jgi:ubiquinol-cytochrome c reductase cytochrome b subunit